ncbi:MFS transporter [Nocardia farcinica]
MTALRTFRTFDRPARLLMINRFNINLGFYMLMPYLAGHLAGPLGLAAWAVGLVLGIRNFSQQGMFLLGGTLADRIGDKPLIVAGCLLRTAGFGLLVFAETLPALLIASAATGFAGTLFNPAVRAYLAADASERRVEAFALFNVFYQAGILAGPLVGLAMTAVDFRITAGAAALIFAVLTVAQWCALPTGPARTGHSSVLQDWRTVLGNRRFTAFAVVMTGSYVLSFQVYLALPLHARVLSEAHAQALTSAIFVVSGVVAVAGQLRITAWLLAAALLAVGTAAVFPFEMDTVVALAGGRLVATHYGYYNTVVGVGILAGNLLTGTVLGAAHAAGAGWAVWTGLAAVGAVSAVGLHLVERRVAAPPRVTPAASTAAP